MALHLITGHKGEPHIYPIDIGAFNAGIYGKGEYVLNTGETFAIERTADNEFKIKDGDAVIQGRHISLEAGTTETLTIANAEISKVRNDIIVMRYTKSTENGVENVAFEVVKGESVASNPVDPLIVTGDILSGNCTLHEFPLYRVRVSDSEGVGTPEKLFEVMGGVDNLHERINDTNANLSAFKNAFAKHLKISTYKGDGKASQFINLGFTPDAVYVCRTDGRTVLHQDNSGDTYEVEYYGGLALKDSACRWWDSVAGVDYPVVKIVKNGFEVYNTPWVTSNSTTHRIFTNETHNFHYIAIRMTDI